MAKFVYLYTGGGMPETPEEGEKVMQAWMSWLGGLGDSVTDTGNPFGASTALRSGGPGATASGASGYSIVEADSLDDATKKADGCPILASGGAVEIFEAVTM